MQYVALLSGGKDSCFNLLHCHQNGHRLVAAASLGPEPGKEEIDSYLYQTVGQDAIQLVADALEVPLLRRVIRGVAIHQGSEYGSRNKLGLGVQGDETEDLFELLSEVKAKFPDIRGVSVGAILSNYQRVRVENVCQRLSLVPLCYLWQRDQSELLSEMIEAGLEAILIKVAGIGLTTKHLGKSLVQVQPTLLKLNNIYGLHVCGEGGEYESLTLNSPLFKHRIVLEEMETVILSDSPVATVAFLRVTRAHLERKPEYIIPETLSSGPPILSFADKTVADAISCTWSTPTLYDPSPALEKYLYQDVVPKFNHHRKTGSWVALSNVEISHPTVPGLSVEDEVRACFESVQDQLANYSLDLSHVANITILIASMDLFLAVNVVYASFFGVSPPARACVAVELPYPTRVRLECIAHVESQAHERHSLHVQSLSYWAPANIGPYSQAITVGERVFISGQIGLIPASNTLPEPPSLPTETALSLRHVRSVGDVVKAAPWDCVIQGVISWLVHKNDILAVKCGMSASGYFHSGCAPTLFVTVKGLPKNALVETQVQLHTMRRAPSEDEEGPVKLSPTFSRGNLPGLTTCWEVSSFEDSDSSLAIVACDNNDDELAIVDGLGGVLELQDIWKQAICVRLFHTSNAAPHAQRLLRFLWGLDGLPCITLIPCQALATWERDSWDYALCIIV